MFDFLKDISRMWVWALMCLVTSTLLWHYYPAQLSNVLAKLNLLSLAAFAGYWLDRTAFQDRVHRQIGMGLYASWLRRAMIIVGTMLATALAL